jgi:hypothetical protein
MFTCKTKDQNLKEKLSSFVCAYKCISQHVSNTLNTKLVHIPTSQETQQDQMVNAVPVNNGSLFSQSWFIFKDTMWQKCGGFQG